MKLYIGPSNEDLSEGFEKNDLLGKFSLSRNLTRLFESFEDGSVSILNGRWGSGKSTFIKQWAADLEKNSQPHIYFNAFASDHLATPFIAIVGTFVGAVHKLNRQQEPRYKLFLERASIVGKKLGALSAKTAVKALSFGIISGTEIDATNDVLKTIIEGASDLTNEGVKSLIEQYSENQTTIDELRQSISDLPSLMSSPDIENPHLIVFIDELDRCRPDFALGVLELLKHFFGSPNIHFVLVTNLDFLKLSVNHIYGSGDFSGEYLEKFYDFVINFEYDDPDFLSKAQYISEYMAEKHIEPGSSAFFAVTGWVTALTHAFDLTLRQMRALHLTIALALTTFGESSVSAEPVLCLLAFLKIKQPSMFLRLKQKNLDLNEVINYLRGVNWQDTITKNYALNLFRYYLDDKIKLASDIYIENRSRGAPGAPLSMEDYSEEWWIEFWDLHQYMGTFRRDVLATIAIRYLEMFSPCV